MYYSFGDYRKKRDWPKVFRICFSALFIKRLELFYFTAFRKMRECDDKWQIWVIGMVNISALSFKNLPDKSSIVVI